MLGSSERKVGALCASERGGGLPRNPGGVGSATGIEVTFQKGNREYLLYSVLPLISQTLKRMRSFHTDGYRSHVFCVIVFTAVSCLLLWPFVIKSLQKGFFCAIDAMWVMDEALKLQQARFVLTQDELENAPIWVVSVESARDRRSAVLANFHRENVTFDFVNAVDASCGIPAGDLHRFVGPKLASAIRHGERAPIIRAETAAAISHLHLFDRTVRQQIKVAIQFEDDVVLLPDFKGKALQLFNQLPEDWDFMYLSDCQKTDDWTPTGKFVDTDILTLRRGPCTTGFAYRTPAATKVLQHVQKHGLGSPFDVMLGSLAFAKKIHMYTSSHRLAKVSRVASVIQHSGHHNQKLNLPPWDSARRGLRHTKP